MSKEMIDKKITYKLKYIDSTSFIPLTLSNFVDNLVEEINKCKCENCIDNYE